MQQSTFVVCLSAIQLEVSTQPIDQGTENVIMFNPEVADAIGRRRGDRRSFVCAESLRYPVRNTLEGRILTG